MKAVYPTHFFFSVTYDFAFSATQARHNKLILDFDLLTTQFKSMLNFCFQIPLGFG